MSNLTNEQKVQQALDAAIPDIVESLKKELVQGITWEVKNIIQQQVLSTVKEWYSTNMVSEINALLVESKLGLLGVTVPFAEQLQEELLKGMVEQLKANLSQSYSRNKVMEALFK